ncbi:MAG TPA: hypothetical protein VIM61_04350 [Chthoniobacterales bacterium]|jgi:hypothetical protein
MNFEEILEERRQAVAQSIRPLSSAEVTALGESLFPHMDDPWRERFFNFLSENPEALIHHAELPDGVQLLYSRSHNRGIWFIPGKGMGIIQTSGLKALSEIFGGAA